MRENEPLTSLPDFSLEDKYGLGTGRVYLTGLQALVRVPLARLWESVEAEGRTATAA